jgi:hypothetical protein
MKSREVYYYLFYKLYKFWETVSTPKFWSDWKASLSMDVLIYFLVQAFFIYYNVLIDRESDLGESTIEVILLVGVVSISNYFIFHHKDQWREIVHEFDKWPKEKNKRGNIIAATVIFTIIVNLIFSFYLMSQVDWSQYR